MILLSRYYRVKIVINQDRLNYIQQMKVNVDKYFTLDPSESWIESIPKNER